MLVCCTESGLPVVIRGLLQLLLGVHYEGAVLRHWLTDGPTLQHQHLRLDRTGVVQFHRLPYNCDNREWESEGMATWVMNRRSGTGVYLRVYEMSVRVCM